jgi:hypothetical protein
MQFTAFILAAFAGLAAAGPIQERQLGLCSSALDTAQCCDLSVDGVLVLNCESRTSTSLHRPFQSPSNKSTSTSELNQANFYNLASTTPTSTADFNNICAAGGQSAQCCTLPLVRTPDSFGGWEEILANLMIQAGDALLCHAP